MSTRAYAVVRLTGSNIRRFINLCTANHLKIWDLRYIKTCEYEACCFTEDIFSMKAHLKKTHTRLVVKERKGIFSFLGLIHRFRIAIAAFISVAGIFLMLGMRIWSIEVSGNRFLSSVTITDYVLSNDITCGCYKQSDYKWLEHKIEENYADIMWCSIYLEGCTLKIDISEGINYR